MLEAENRENRKSKGVKKREQIVDHNNKFTILLLYTYTTILLIERWIQIGGSDYDLIIQQREILEEVIERGRFFVYKMRINDWNQK